MQNKESVDDSTQVGCEDIDMSSRRERKSLTDSLSRVLERVYEDEDIESMSDYEDDHYNSNMVYSEDDYYDSEVVYSEDDDWEEASFKDYLEQIYLDDDEYYRRDNEEWRRAKALPAKVKSDSEYDYYDSEVVYTEEVDEDEDYWKERPFEDLQELINDSENTTRDNEEWRRAKALPTKVQIFSDNKMENKMSVDDSTQVGCDVEDDKEVEDVEKKVEEEEEWEDHKMSFYLDENPEYEIEAVAEWRENSDGEMVGYADIYFIHPVTRLRCKSVKDCFVGWSEPNEEVTKKWETLCQRIEALENIDEYVLTSSVVGL